MQFCIFLISRGQFCDMVKDHMGYSYRKATEGSLKNGTSSKQYPKSFTPVYKMSKLEEKEKPAEKVGRPPVKYRHIICPVLPEDLNDEVQVPTPPGRNMRAYGGKQVVCLPEKRKERLKELEQARESAEKRDREEKKADKLINQLLQKGKSLCQIEEELSEADIPLEIIEQKLQKLQK